MKIIFDCDNTMGVPGCDVDDGLALFYLLGKENVEICGITTTYGNSDIATVYRNTVYMLREIGRSDINIFKGCPNRYALHSEAVDFILRTVQANPGMVSILATGSLTNLYAAFLRDPLLFDKVAQVVVMGGLTERLLINGKVLDELNFSCDPTATQVVLKEAKNLTVITGNRCLDCFFDQAGFCEQLALSQAPAAQYIQDKCAYWFEEMMRSFNLQGFYNWDVIAAAYLVNPVLFRSKSERVAYDPKSPQSGLLVGTTDRENSCLVNMPIIEDPEALRAEIYQTWLNVQI